MDMMVKCHSVLWLQRVQYVSGIMHCKPLGIILSGTIKESSLLSLTAKAWLDFLIP